MAQDDAKLVRLDDFEGELDEEWQEMKSRKVKDKNGDEIGTVEDVYVYESAGAVHLVKTEVDGGHYLVPADAITTADENGIEVEQNKATITSSAQHDSDEPPDTDTSRAAYEHFGYPDQLALG